eukprot:TRINITY_DN35293_c0_g1_i1.p2 TRINITY_DN35293_c0_g1~~TRINITY_DN35293_c0_g1_i1.p2  ORF type:complete len:101 (+),score=18.80 TRINITY_DN35293_c0_g1_i1:106-408(+)
MKGTTLNVKVGDVLQFKEDSNPSTGYSWLFQFSNYLLKQQDGFAPTPSPTVGGEQMVGVGGTQCTTFTCLRPGTTQLGITYGRPWEAQNSPSSVITVVIS